MTELARWDTFYAIVGSAAGSLIGLQFVVMTLIAARPPARSTEAGASFSTPTIVHFGAVLFLAAMLHAPWPSIAAAAILWGAMGFIGFVYTAMAARRIRKQDVYRPVFEDWLFHAILPLLAYAILTLSPAAAASHVREMLFGVGGATLLLLFAGIHNAWDSVAYHVFVRAAPKGKTDE